MREKLTLILFKDHLTSRTLKLPVHWLPRLGLLWLIAMFLTLCLAVLLGRVYLRGSPGDGFAAMRSEKRAEELEKQLEELKASYDALQGRTQGGTAPTVGQEKTTVGFSAFPPVSIRNGLPARDTLPFRLEPLKAQWRGNTLQLTTAIEYIRDDGGNQQGHFVIFARGPQNLYTYPDGALSPVGTDVLVRPEAGEYFSVSRYREIRANFGPAQSKESIQAIELYIFDAKKNLIFVERAAVEQPKPKAPPKPTPTPTPTPTAPPADSASELSPGTGALPSAGGVSPNSPGTPAEPATPDSGASP